MNQVWFLKGLQGQYENQELELPREVVWLGRAVIGTPNSNTHIFFEDGAVSRVHGALAWVDEFSAYVIHHRSQTNPTFLNDVPVGEPQLVKSGDIISFGHQRLQVCCSTAAESRSLTSEPPQDEEGGLEFKCRVKGQTSTLRGVGTIILSLDPAHDTAVAPERDAQATLYKLPAPQSAELAITAGEKAGCFRLRGEGSDLLKIHRVTTTDSLILDVPFPVQASCDFGPSDKIVYQGLEIWPSGGTGNGMSEISSDTTVAMGGFSFRRPLTENPDRGKVEFQTGEWRGVTVLLAPEEDNGVEIGPGKSVAGYSIPLEDGPTCRIFYRQGHPHIEVTEAVEGHYVSVNGELLFSIQANQLISGSSIFLGKTMLCWTLPAVQAALSEYRLEVGENIFPISRSVVRIGTATHCEVLLEGSGLGPVTGTLEYRDRGFVYKHLDGSIHGQLNDDVIISGDKVKLAEGSTLQIGLDTVITLKKK